MSDVLRIENLGHSYGKFKVIEDISLSIGKGEMSALIGPNGAGKTTFYNAISGHFPPTKGKVFLNGEEITGLTSHKVVDKGMCRSFQITNIFSELTVLENVIAPLIIQRGKHFKIYGNIFKDKQIVDSAMQTLEQVGLSDRADQVVANLAYGDKRLVEMAIVLARKPSVVLLDEPTAGMNPEETENMIALIKKLATGSGTTFFITEHDMKVVFSLAEKIYVLHQGHLLAQGSPEQIRSNEQVQEAYLGRKVHA
ncbi:amino acid/amide ABC transporter ATP-binding protein 1, HAAT family [Malonomonas rubra DSM 5091]|uniref:Amino acid/amide ABC transporter ATP-binding protein 1, HAAT family n=1 Tax=Malonomonas rubra DSM 5091 TaxID=1122189 RepID=A0A1M6JB56_MALRU|nr:ABC transporter ATP-binding protein [Malonomonas rubra]SHJ43901.1 amino acid/amide ABC transporter ATP-binding protein 1, HAAT family [Malonomonas rubra DSM 5091]